MERKHNKDNVPFAKDLRKNMTKEERHLWYDFLRTYPVRFQRQKVMGKYILDFYCPEIRLCIELDGEPHFTQEGREHDDQRTEYLMRLHGIRVLRFENQDVFKYSEGVLNEIRNAIMECKVLQQFPYRPLRPTRGHLP